MTAGRPRTVSLPPDEMIKLGEEMIEWVKKNDPLHLSQFYSIYKGYTDAQWRVMTEAAEFSPYYERALQLVGLKYLAKDSPIEPSLKQRWQRVYFKDIKRDEDAKLNEDLERAKKLEDHKAKLRADYDQSTVSDAVKELSQEIRRRNHITNPD